MAAKPTSIRPRRPLPRSLHLESLESRALLAVSGQPIDPMPLASSGDEPAAMLLSTTSTSSTPSIDSPWLTYAGQSALGTLIARVTVSPPPTATAEPDARIDLVQARFNGLRGSGDPSSQPAANASTPQPAPRLTGVAFPGSGVPTQAADSWPIPLEAFDAYKPVETAGPQEWFVVFESDSDAMLATLSFILGLASDPALTQGSPPADPAGLGGLSGPPGSAAGGDTVDQDSLAAFATFAGFAAFAGLDDGDGPSVSLRLDSGSSDADRVTNDGRLTVEAPPGGKVQYSLDGGRTWKSSFRAREGENAIDVRTIDAGGTASPTRAFSFTLDRKAPPAPRVALAIDSGRSASDGITNSSDLAIGSREAGSTLEYSLNGSGWMTTWTPSEGRNLVRVRQIDAAGNASKPSKPLVFRFDSQIAAVMPAAGRANAGQRLLGVERGAAVMYSVDAGATWSQRRPASAHRGTTLVRQIDAAGNHSIATSFTS